MKKKKCKFTIFATLLFFTFSQNTFIANAIPSDNEENASTQLLIEPIKNVDNTTPISSESKEISKEEITNVLSNYSDMPKENVPHSILVDDTANNSADLDYVEPISLLTNTSNSTNSLTKRAVSVLNEETPAENTSKFNVIGMNVNTYLYGQIKEEDEERWYLTSAPKGKLTVYLQHASGNNSMDLNLYLYKYDPNTSSMSKVASSVYKGNSPEQLSFVVPETGYYFMKVTSYSDFNANNQFALVVLSSPKYDDNEADDNMNTKDLKNYMPTSINKTLDNVYDVDWLEFNIPTEQNIYCNFTYKDTNAAYKMAVYDSSFKCLGTLNQNNYFSAKLVGNFYLKVWTDKGSNADTPYNINFLDLDNLKNAPSISENSNFVSGNLTYTKPTQWYKYDITSPKDISFALNAVDTNSKCAVDFYDSNYNLICTAKDKQFSSRENFPVGTYYFRLRNLDDSNTPSPYSIFFTNYSRLNTMATYNSLPGNISFNLNSSTPDKWIYIKPNTPLRFQMEFRNTDENCTLALYDNNLNLIATFKSNYIYTGTVPASGVYIRIARKYYNVSSSGSLNITNYTPSSGSSGGGSNLDELTNTIDRMCYSIDKKIQEMMNSLYMVLSKL
ncbi:pre-peptidase C-terminal domain-containing protein [uncultured Clostridium sp.]|uniref:pre-peptidase C-terminal domain-containing protein n=1 Tax=uncultured Clostridium sp. TaxID=59620 RepID=UPI0025E4AAB3|nr:pre-peptidase C-terminal domain-containing protein [uncultured Clostridium sp.]